MNETMIKRNIILGSLLVSLSLISNAQVNDPVILMTVGDRPVPLSEFKAMYYNNLSKDSLKNPKALDNYLKLFIEFRLKVNCAMDAKLDTTTSFKQEMNEYRQKLADPKMRDTLVENRLIKEAYERTKWDIRAKHILIKVSPDASPADTLAAFNKIMAIRAKIIKGDTTFEAAAKKYSEDTYSKEKGGDLGYFTSLGMVYPFETVAYNTKTGEVSKPVRTQFGYHIIKVVDKRADVGQIEVAHIMIRTNAKMTAADSLKAKAKADSIYQLVKHGEDFTELAKKFSQDQSSARHGGVLPWFGVGRMGRVPEFEKAAFEMKNIGDVCGPIKTEFGWHIIKLIGKKPLQPFDSVKDAITSRVMKDGRSDASVNTLVVQVEKKYGFKENPEAKKEMAGLIDESFYKGKWSADKAKGNTTPVFTLEGHAYTIEDFAHFAAKNQMSGLPKGGDYAVDMLYPKFVKTEVLQFKNDHLEREDGRFAEQIAQYRDGILLFDITDQMVWTKALKDTAGLKQFHEMHKMDYMWKDRCDATIYTCSNNDVAGNVKSMINAGKSDKDILSAVNGQTANSLSITSGKYEKGDNGMVDATNWSAGISSNMSGKDGKVVFVNVKAIIPSGPKTLDEVRGLATTDYQNYLMAQWLTDLKAKYPVHVNQDVLKRVIPQ